MACGDDEMTNARARAFFDLTGRVAIATSGNGGIGRAPSSIEEGSR